MAVEDRVRELAGEVEAADAGAMEAARARHLALTKPPGSMGRLEELGVRLAGISGAVPPPVAENPAVVVAAGDHGVLTGVCLPGRKRSRRRWWATSAPGARP